jgi:type I restriction enzyme S subunit
MEVKPGYKQTEVGVIPEEWEVTPFADLFEFRNGVNADKVSYGKGVRFINVLEPITYSHIYGPEITGQVTLPESVATSYAVRRGDILFNRTSETQEEVGLAAVYLGTERVVFGGFVIRGRPVDQSLDPIYSGYALRAPIIRSQIIPMGQGAIRANIGQQNLGLVVAPVPPLSEQCGIAEALSDVDALLGALNRLTTKKRDLKHAAMQQLLTGQTRLLGFQGQWKSIKFGDLLKYERPEKYIVRSADYAVAGETPVLTANKSFILGYTNEKFGICNRLPAIIFDDFTTDTKYVDFPFKIKSSAIKILRAGSEEVNLKFVFERMRLVNFPLGEHKRYYISEYRHIELPTPEPDEQSAIAAVLFDMDADLAALERRRNKTRALKQAMMHELLIGNTRLVLGGGAHA